MQTAAALRADARASMGSEEHAARDSRCPSPLIALRPSG